MYSDLIKLNDSEFSAEDIVLVIRSLRLNGLPIPKSLEEKYDEIENIQRGRLSSVLSSPGSSKPIFPLSRADKLIAQRYVFNNPNEIMVPNQLLDGFRLDMDFPEIKLNIELDGPSHSYPSKARYDKIRDEYLSVKRGYKVQYICSYMYSIFVLSEDLFIYVSLWYSQYFHNIYVLLNDDYILL